jgi:hypothetical protein
MTEINREESDMEDGMRSKRFHVCPECGWLIGIEDHEPDCPNNEKES